MILIDTSVWVDLLGSQKRFSLSSEKLLEVATCPPVIQEVLQGIKNDLIHKRVKESFLAFPCLEKSVSTDLYLSAADIYRSGRGRGFTIRSSTDCLIAAIALQHKIAIWHYDRDYEVIARFTSLKTVSQF